MTRVNRYLVGRDHFDQKVEASLRRDLPIVTTAHAQKQLTDKSADSFTKASALDPFESTMVDSSLGHHRLRVTGMPGKRIPSKYVVKSLNSILHAASTQVFFIEFCTSN